MPLGYCGAGGAHGDRTRDLVNAMEVVSELSAEDLYELQLWRESDPEAPEGAWYKDFGSFKICGDGEYPKTFLLRGQSARGEKL